MQKATYFLQKVTAVPLEYEFVLYKHGPFSFDLMDELGGMRTRGFLAYEIVNRYGPRLKDGPAAQQLRREFPQPAADYRRQIQMVAGLLRDRGVMELERLGTALYVNLDGTTGRLDRAQRIVELKPHIALEEAENALHEVDAFLGTALMPILETAG
jgi:uncharacterized protein YwgA